MNFSRGATISVIVAVRNNASTLERCVQSVARQSYPHIDLVVIDGASTDGSVEVIRRHSADIGSWISEPDKGIYDAWNKGLRYAKGDWICFLGADDYLWTDRVLEQMAVAMAACAPATRLAYGRVALLNAAGAAIISVVGDPWPLAKKNLDYRMSVPHPGLMHHRTWFTTYGVFDRTYRIAGDYEMLLRGWPHEEALFVPDVIVVGMAQGGLSSNPGNVIRSLDEIARAREAHGVHSHRSRLAAAYVRAYVRRVAETLLGRRIAYRLLDLARRAYGKPPYWTKI